MNKKILAALLVGVLVVGTLTGILIFTMGKTSADEGKPNFVVTSFGVSKHNVLVNNDTTVTVGVMNNGTADGVYKLNITIDGVSVKSSSVAVGKGNTATVSYNISSSSVGNHTVAVGDNSTYLNCFDRFAADSYMTFHAIESDTTYGVLEYNWTSSVMSVNATGYTLKFIYENNVYPMTIYDYNKSDLWSRNMENVTFVGMESVSTAYGVKTLAHYTYTFESSGYHYEVDIFRDDKTGAYFKMITKTTGFVMTEELINTNRDWMKDI